MFFLLKLHLVHWNEDLYDSFEEAAKREDGIIIIAVFLKVPVYLFISKSYVVYNKSSRCTTDIISFMLNLSSSLRFLPVFGAIIIIIIVILYIITIIMPLAQQIHKYTKCSKMQEPHKTQNT